MSRDSVRALKMVRSVFDDAFMNVIISVPSNNMIPVGVDLWWYGAAYATAIE
jgi:hypothetical protein